MQRGKTQQVSNPQSSPQVQQEPREGRLHQVRQECGEDQDIPGHQGVNLPSGVNTVRTSLSESMKQSSLFMYL